jgi:hypothetical protein
VVRVDQTWHDDASRGVYYLCAFRLKIRADRRDLIAFDEHITYREIRDSSVHRDDGATLEKSASIVLRFHGQFLSTALARLTSLRLEGEYGS